MSSGSRPEVHVHQEGGEGTILQDGGVGRSDEEDLREGSKGGPEKTRHVR